MSSSGAAGIEGNNDGELSEVRKKRVLSTDASSGSYVQSSNPLRCLRFSGSLAYNEDPYNKPEHENTLRGRELIIFVVGQLIELWDLHKYASCLSGYAIAVLIILALFESILPVVFASGNDDAQQRLAKDDHGAHPSPGRT